MESPKIPGSLTGCAGEYFVAYRLSAMGYVVALTRAGTLAVDLIVTTADGKKAVTIQVKTKRRAFSPATKKDPTSCWYWQIGAKARDFQGKSVFYAFVDLNLGEEGVPTPMPMPDVFIVPADDVAGMMEKGFHKGLHHDDRTSWVSVWGEPPKSKMFFFHIEADEDRNEKQKKWKENWELIERALDVSK